MQGKPLVTFKGERPTRIGVFPKLAEDAGEIKWFELPASFAFHVANAWQEGNVIRVFLSLYEEGVSKLLVRMHCSSISASAIPTS